MAVPEIREQNFGLIRINGKPVVKPIPIPKVPDDYILVRTVAIALNPTDWTTIDAVGDDGTIVGCDYSGIVEYVGPAVTAPFKKGDRIAGIAHGANDANPENGAFARYIAVKGDIQIHVPEGLTFQAASAAGVGVISAGYAMYKLLELPLPQQQPTSTDKTILIYGGSTATGTIAIQFAKLSGFKVITVCSPRNFELVKSNGADEAYDYREDGIGKKIRQQTNDNLSLVLDTVGLDSSAAICSDAIGSAGGLYCNLLEAQSTRSDVKSLTFLGYSQSGESFIFEGQRYEAQPDDFDFARKFARVADDLWAKGAFRPHPQRVGEHGLYGAIDGMEEMRQGRVSGEKLVYSIEDTAWPPA